MSSLNTNDLLQSSTAFIWVKKELAKLHEALEYFQPLLTVFDTPGLEQLEWESRKGTGKGCSLSKSSCLSPKGTWGVSSALGMLVPLFCRSELFGAQEKPGEQPPPEPNSEWLRWKRDPRTEFKEKTWIMNKAASWPWHTSVRCVHLVTSKGPSLPAPAPS